MSADQLIFQADRPTHQDEWIDFDNLFEFPSSYLDSNPTSVNSISPRDYDLSFTETDVFNWDSDPALSSQTLFHDFVNYDTPLEPYGQPMLSNSQPLIDPNNILHQAPPLPQEEFIGAELDSVWLHDAQSVEDPFYSSIRHVVESQAALDPRCFTRKEKMRDASIALHMQRLQDASMPNLDMPSHSSTGFSSPSWPDSPPGAVPPGKSRSSPATSSFSDTTGKSSSSPSTSGSESGATGMQLVLDLNMNTTTNVPRKQKPRSKAQKENYIKARKYGVCEKHRKQHKRCNCLEKAAAVHLSVTEPSCADSRTGVGLNKISPSLHVNSSSQRPVKHVTGIGLSNINPGLDVNAVSQRFSKHVSAAIHSGQPRLQVKQTARTPMPDLSPTRHLQQFVPTSGQHPNSAQNQHPLPPGRQELGNAAVRWRLKTRQATQSQHTNSRLDERRDPRPDHHPLDTQTNSVNRGIANVQKHLVTTQSLTKQSEPVVQRAAIGRFSFWQSSTTLSSWASVFFGRFVMFSSELYMRSRKGMGLL